MMPPEILKWADIPTITAVVWISQMLRPMAQQLDIFRGDRIYYLPLLLGVSFGLLTEFSTPTFDVFMAIRRTLVDGFASVGVFRGYKIFIGNGGKEALLCAVRNCKDRILPPPSSE